MSSLVECHSGSSYANYPTAVHWQGLRLRIVQIKKEWRTPIGKHFRVQTADQQVFQLSYDPVQDHWQVQQL